MFLRYIFGAKNALMSIGYLFGILISGLLTGLQVTMQIQLTSLSVLSSFFAIAYVIWYKFSIATKPIYLDKIAIRDKGRGQILWIHKDIAQLTM